MEKARGVISLALTFDRLRQTAMMLAVIIRQLTQTIRKLAHVTGRGATGPKLRLSRNLGRVAPAVDKCTS
jgi:hypothetical protein